jgi:WD40 repeat protein
LFFFFSSLALLDMFVNNYFTSCTPDNFHDKEITVTTTFKDKNNQLVLITGDKKGKVKTWNVETGKLSAELFIHSEPITAIAIYREVDDKTSEVKDIKIITASEDKVVPASTEDIKIITASEDKVVPASTAPSVAIWNYETSATATTPGGQSVTDIPKVFKSYLYKVKVTCLTVCSRSKVIVFATSDECLHLWKVTNTNTTPNTTPNTNTNTNISANTNDLVPFQTIRTAHTDLILSVAVLSGHVKNKQSCDERDIRIVSVGWDKKMYKYHYSELSDKAKPSKPSDKAKPADEADSKWNSNLFEKGHTKSITCLVAHYPSGEQQQENEPPILITGSLDKSAIIWDFETGTKVRVLRGHEGQINAVKVVDRDDDGSPPIVITASKDNQIILWDLVTGDKIRTIKHFESFNTLAVSDSEIGIVLFSAGKVRNSSPEVYTLLIWDLRRTYRTKDFKTAAVTAIDIYVEKDNDGNFHQAKNPQVLIGCVDGKFNLFDLGKETPIKDDKQKLAKHVKRINAGLIFPPSSLNEVPVVVSGDGDGQIKTWNLKGDMNERTEKAEAKAVLTVAMYDPELFGADRVSGLIRKKGDTHASPNRSLVDIYYPCVITGGFDLKIQVWDFLGVYRPENTSVVKKKGNVIAEIEETGHTQNVRSIVIYHPINPADPPLFISGSYDKTTILWKLETLEKLRIFQGFHTDYVLFTAIYDPNIQYTKAVFDEETQTKVYKNQFYDSRYHMPAVITSSYDGRVAVWDMFGSDTDANSGNGKSPSVLYPKLPTGKLRYSINAHTESVTALAVYTPRNDCDEPLILTGSIDKLVIIWNLFSGEKIHTLVGHTDRVCWIKLFDPPGLLHPLILSGGDDKQTIVWEDALYQKPFMPLREIVRNAYLSDVENTENKDWLLITEMATLYKGLFFTENSNLFLLAVKNGRSDFLIKFWDYLVETLPTMKPAVYQKKLDVVTADGGAGLGLGAPSTDSAAAGSLSSPRSSTPPATPFSNNAGNNMSNHSLSPSGKNRSPSNVDLSPSPSRKRLTRRKTKKMVNLGDYKMVTHHEAGNEGTIELDILHLAIIKCDLLAVRAITLAWIKNLNKDMDSMLTQRLYHPSYYLPEGTLKLLYDFYPSEFVFFIKSLKLIRNHFSLLKPLSSSPVNDISKPAPALAAASAVMNSSAYLVVGENEDNIADRAEVNQMKDLSRSERYEYRGSDNRVNYFDTFWKNDDDMKKYVREIDGVRYPLLKRWDDLRIAFDLTLLESYYQFSEFFSKAIPPQPVTSLMMPFRDCSKLLDYLQWFVDVSNQLDNVDIFNSEISKVMLSYFWHIRGRRAHVLAFMKYLMFFCIFTTCIYSFEPIYAKDGGIIFLNILTILLLVAYGMEEGIQLLNIRKKVSWKTVAKHFVDLWNFNDFIISFTGIIGLILRLSYYSDTPTGRAFLAISSVGVYFKILYFLRPFAATGPLGKCCFTFPSYLFWLNSWLLAFCAFLSFSLRCSCDGFRNCEKDYHFFICFVLFISRICSSILAFIQ